MSRLIRPCFVLSLLMITLGTASAGQEPKPPALTPEEQKLAAQAEKLNNEGTQLFDQGKFAEAVVRTLRSLELRQKLYPASKYPDGHPALADCLTGLGLAMIAQGAPDKALGYFEQALAMRQKLYPASRYPDGHPLLALSLTRLGYVLQELEAY